MHYEPLDQIRFGMTQTLYIMLQMFRRFIHPKLNDRCQFQIVITATFYRYALCWRLYDGYVPMLAVGLTQVSRGRVFFLGNTDLMTLPSSMALFGGQSIIEFGVEQSVLAVFGIAQIWILYEFRAELDDSSAYYISYLHHALSLMVVKRHDG